MWMKQERIFLNYFETHVTFMNSRDKKKVQFILFFINFKEKTKKNMFNINIMEVVFFG